MYVCKCARGYVSTSLFLTLCVRACVHGRARDRNKEKKRERREEDDMNREQE